MLIHRICCYCRQPFEVKPQAGRRTYCFALDCIKARRAFERAYKLEFDRAQRNLAQLEEPDGAVAEAPKLRRCLRCDKRFRSKGPHNRICLRCKDSEIWRRASFDAVPRYW